MKHKALGIIIFCLFSTFYIECQENSTNYRVSINKVLNSAEDEFLVKPLNACQLLMYNSRKNAINDYGLSGLYLSDLTYKKCAEPIQLTNAHSLNMFYSFNFDKNRKILIYTKCPLNPNADLKCGLYYSFVEGELIGESFPIEIPVNFDVQKWNIDYAYFSNQHQILLFEAQLPGGLGDIDIWYSKYDVKTDSWSKPINAGPKVNTKGKEMSPFLKDDGTLYFSSNGHKSLGGYDIFKASSEGGALKWDKVEALNSTINSEFDEYEIIFNDDSEGGFLVSNRKEGMGKRDIYEFRNANDSHLYSAKPDSLLRLNDMNKELVSKAILAMFKKEECNKAVDEKIIPKTKLFPVTNKSTYVFELEGRKNTRYKIRVSSSYGKVVFNEEILYEKEKYVSTLKFDKAAKGAYYMCVLNGCQILTMQKFFIE